MQISLICATVALTWTMLSFTPSYVLQNLPHSTDAFFKSHSLSFFKEEKLFDFSRGEKVGGVNNKMVHTSHRKGNWMKASEFQSRRLSVYWCKNKNESCGTVEMKLFIVAEAGFLYTLASVAAHNLVASYCHRKLCQEDRKDLWHYKLFTSKILPAVVWNSCFSLALDWNRLMEEPFWLLLLGLVRK